MKKICKVSVSVLLAILLFATIALPSLAEARTGGEVPIVYVPGQGTYLYNSEGNIVFPYDFPNGAPANAVNAVPDGYILEAVKVCLPLLVEALTSGDITEYAEALKSYVYPVFDDFQLDENGEASNGVRVSGWTGGSLPDKADKNGNYGLESYYFRYDWRLDPVSNAAILNNYIEAVKAATGSDRVNLVGRCEGVCIVAAYLHEYGSADIKKAVLYNSAATGMESVSAVFSCEIVVDDASVARYADGYIDLGDEFLNQFILETVKLLDNTYALGISAKLLEKLVYDVLYPIIPDLILNTYGTFPGIWAMVDTARYEAARELVFGSRMDEYAQMIEKTDYYNNEIKANVDEILLKAAEDTEIAVLSKYGYQIIPITEHYNELSDGAVLLTESTFGATTAKVDEQFDERYMLDAQMAGTDKYIAPDRTVDSSTCLFPDTTWIIKGINHTDYSAGFDPLMLKYLRTENFDIFSSEQYPQYMVSVNNTVSPMTEENCQAAQKWSNMGFFTTWVRFFRNLYTLLSSYFKTGALPFSVEL